MGVVTHGASCERCGRICSLANEDQKPPNLSDDRVLLHQERFCSRCQDHLIGDVVASQKATIHEFLKHFPPKGSETPKQSFAPEDRPMSYRTAASVEPEESSCGFCGGEPHDIYACAQKQADVAAMAAKKAKRFAILAVIFSVANCIFQFLHLVFKYHWFGPQAHGVLRAS